MKIEPILVRGQWRPAHAPGTFRAENPVTGEGLPGEFPVSDWSDCEEALSAAADAAADLRGVAPEKIAAFLTCYADRIEACHRALVDLAHLETGLPKAPRLGDVELPRTTGQLRQAAAAVVDGSWALPTIDAKLNIRSILAPLGPVLVFGPNNFPFAFNGVSGGDFAAAIASGNSVIAKAHPSHPGTTRLLAEQAFAAVGESGLPSATVQLLYHVNSESGLRMVADSRLGATSFTGSRAAGMKLKAAADAAGKLIYLELSSLNPVVILPGALAERGGDLAAEFAGSALMGSGQFCTSPNVVLLFAGDAAEAFIADVRNRLEAVPPAPLLSSVVLRSLTASVATLVEGGAQLVTGGAPFSMPGSRFENTLLRVTGADFLAAPKKLQTEAFGNASLIVTVRDLEEAAALLAQLEGNLTGCIYSDTQGSDDALYDALEPLLRARVGRLLNDKMPTGVAVSPAMMHGGPYPSTGHPGFTAVGIPASLRRFAQLQCYDNVRPSRLPVALRN